MLNKEEKTLLYRIINAQAEMEGVISCDSFLRGFKLGCKLMIEVAQE